MKISRPRFASSRRFDPAFAAIPASCANYARTAVHEVDVNM